MNKNKVEEIEEDTEYAIEGVWRRGDADDAYVSLNAWFGER